MKARAIARFTVAYGRLRLQVRLLPTIADVDAEYREGRRRVDGKWTHAFFQPATSPSAAHVGTVVLPANGRLRELVPHEVVHAVMRRLQLAHCSVDERLATAVAFSPHAFLTGSRAWEWRSDMRSLSFGDQVLALGTAVSIRMAEQARLAAERAKQSALMQAGRKHLFHYQGIVGAMQPNRAYRYSELEAAAGLPAGKFKSALTTAVTNRRIDKTPDREGNLYSLPAERRTS